MIIKYDVLGFAIEISHKCFNLGTLKYTVAEFPNEIIDFWITVPRLRSAQSFFANSSGEFFSSAKSHSN